MDNIPDVTRAERGPNARIPTNVLLSKEELATLKKALTDENEERGQNLGLGSKLRELGLLWAKGRGIKVKKGKK